MADTLYVCRVKNGFIVADSENFSGNVKVANTTELLADIVEQWGRQETPLSEHLPELCGDTILSQAEVDTLLKG